MPNPYRLSRSTAPRHYNLRIEPDLTTATFEGVVTIDIDVLESTDVLICNAAELQIHDAIIDGAIATITLDEDHERLTLGSTTELSAGPHRVLIRFTGILNDKLRGFYRSVWTDSDGLEHVIGATQMQATDARRAFPCWDEPDFKATFTITLSIHDGLEAISNSPELTRTNLAGRTVIEFVPTMVMSTYLVAWVVGELEMTEPIDVNGVPLRVVHVPGKAHLTAFGLECGAFGLNWECGIWKAGKQE